jgi:hypothetical protein
MHRLIVVCLLVTASAWAEDGAGSGSASDVGSGSTSDVGSGSARAGSRSASDVGSGSASDVGSGSTSEVASGSASEVASGSASEVNRPDSAREACSVVRGYLEPSLFLAATTSDQGVLGRAALGVQVASCDRNGHEGIGVRFGGTGSVRTAGLGFHGPTPNHNLKAGGVELEIDVPIARRRVGLRAGYEHDDGAMSTAGVRWRSDHGVLAFDAFRSTILNSQCQFTTSIGMMAGVGGDLHLSKTLGFVALGVFALVGLAARINFQVEGR